MIRRRTESNDILLELVAKTLAVGAYEMQVEYEDRKEHVFAFQEGVGFGIASLDASSAHKTRWAPCLEVTCAISCPRTVAESQWLG